MEMVYARILKYQHTIYFSYPWLYLYLTNTEESYIPVAKKDAPER